METSLNSTQQKLKQLSNLNTTQKQYTTEVKYDYSGIYCSKCGGYISGVWTGSSSPMPCTCEDKETVINSPSSEPVPFIAPELPKRTGADIVIPIDKNGDLLFTESSPTEIRQSKPKANVPTGWQCPLCFRIYSPNVITCEPCSNAASNTQNEAL